MKIDIFSASFTDSDIRIEFIKALLPHTDTYQSYILSLISSSLLDLHLIGILMYQISD